jgi:geranylgeranyl diphosphate synthase type II
MRTADELRDAVETYLRSLPLHPELGALEDALRYSLGSGGKRIRPVLCLAVAEATGAPVDRALPGACAIELVHTFSLVHDDLPAMDDDDERRGRPSAHVAFGEGAAILAGDALLAEAFRLALTYETTAIAAELADATLGMISGQYRDIDSAPDDLEELHRLKTARLFLASVRIGLEVAFVPDAEREAWTRFGDAVGLLFQTVDDLLDGDCYVEQIGRAATEKLAEAAAVRTREALADVAVDTSVLSGLVDALAVRTG